MDAILNGSVEATVFDSRISTVNESSRGALLNVSVLRKVDYGYEGNLEYKECLLAPSLLNYSMILNDNILSFKWENWFDEVNYGDPVNPNPIDGFVAPM